MELVNFLLFTLGCAGLTLVFTRSDILESLRDKISNISYNLGYLSNCPMCSGFWVGLAGGFMVGYNPVLSAGLISLVSWSVANVVESLYAVGVYCDEKLENGEE